MPRELGSCLDVVSHIPVCKAEEKHGVHGLGASFYHDADLEGFLELKMPLLVYFLHCKIRQGLAARPGLMGP